MKIFNLFNFNLIIFIKSKRIHKYFKKYKYFIILAIIAIILIRICLSVYLFNYKYIDKEYSTSIDLLVLSKEKQTESYISYLVRIKEKNKFTDKFILYIYKDKDIISVSDKELYYMNYGYFKYGDIINLKGKITIPKSLNNLHEFNYKRFLNSKNIVGTIMSYDATICGTLNSNILTYIYKIRNNLEVVIDSKLPDKEANLFKSMIYGNDSDLDESIKENFTKLGLSHLLAVSGSNVGIVILLLSFIFKKLKLNKVIAFICISIFIFVFCAISDFEISVIRASVIAVVALFASLNSIRLNNFFSLILAFVLIILYNPYSIFNVSFILSFTAFTGIILFSKLINSFFNVYITKIIGINNVIQIKSKEKNKSNKNNKSIIKIVILYKLLKLISNILSLYFSVQILLIPIQIYFFNSITLISIISNLVIYVFSTLELILGFVFIFVCRILYLSEILANLNYLVLWIIIQITNTLMKFNTLEIKLPTPNFLVILCYYIVILFTFYRYKIIFKLEYKFGDKLKNLNVKNIFRIIYLLCFCYIIFFNIYITYFLNFVYYFNVEQGNMALVKSRNKVILVDMGTAGNANVLSILESFMKAYNISKIDYFLITHLHRDHISGLIKLSENESSENNGKETKNKNETKIKIESVIYSIPKNKDNNTVSNYTENSINYVEFEKLLNKLKIKEIIVEKFDKIQIDKDTSIDILNPRDRKIINSKDKVNSNSIVSIISVKNYNYLFMGDSTCESEKVMLEDIYNLENKDIYLNKLKNINAIQIGHHGSNTSTSEYFLKNINVKLAVISAKKSVYGHPSPIVENILKKYSIKAHITEKSGGKMIKF